MVDDSEVSSGSKLRCFSMKLYIKSGDMDKISTSEVMIIGKYSLVKEEN